MTIAGLGRWQSDERDVRRPAGPEVNFTSVRRGEDGWFRMDGGHIACGPPRVDFLQADEVDNHGVGARQE